MDKFTSDAFKRAEELRLAAEADAWHDFDYRERLLTDLAALLAVGPDAARLVQVAQNAGLEDALHEYAEYMMMGGFSRGYKAGQNSMLGGDAK